MPYFLGLDVGTQGARALVCDENGKLIAQAAQPFGDIDQPDLPSGWFEQDPRTWWDAACRCLRQVMSSVKGEIMAIAVDSTSGTLLPVDDNGEPLRRALMYNDARASEEAAACNEAGTDLTQKLGYKFGSSFALPKILWVKRNEPHIFEKTRLFIHAADFIVGRLTGDFSISDYSNALKTGYDLADLCWPDFISDKLGLPLQMLPKVVTPGEIIGTVTNKCAQSTGLAAGTPVAAGISDGTAGFIASGASKVGDWNSTIGTTLVLRGISRELVRDPLGRIYCHRHPDGWWLPGGASNVGGECLAKVFPGEDYAAMDSAAQAHLPTGVLIYPLARKGERLPFISRECEGFIHGQPQNRQELYAAYLQGVAFVERWSLELMNELGADTSGTVYATGGAAKSLTWLKIRADVLGKRIVRPAVTESAMGAAIVAASKTSYSSLSEACRQMVAVDAEIEPDAGRSEAYEAHYKAFRIHCDKMNKA